ncbi:MAG TPA: oligoribonuclease [Gammaproteobacteria bacterium]|nr:oligoribonuclease [Gammaproteobacteria bacterium]
MAQNANNLIWIDLEMTGLDTNSDYIIEVATIVTDGNLNIIEEGPVLAVHQHDEVLDAMDDWNTTQHSRSGLIERVRSSPLDEQDAERITLEFLERHVPPNASPMCGNSICQDRRFLARCMPDLERYFHYRHLDVSTIKELVKRWAPDLGLEFQKNPAHLALEDVRDSIRELQFYRERFFKLPS